MPWRARYIVPRPHPLAVSVYLLVLLLGVFFVTGVFNSEALDALLGRGWQYLWEWLMIVGGITGLIGIKMYSDLEDGLLLEAVGAGTAALGLFVYTACIVDVVGTHTITWLLLVVLGGGCVWRSVQALKDRRLARELGKKADEHRDVEIPGQS